MSKSSKFIRNLWFKARLNAPPVVQQRIIPWLQETKETAQLLTKPYLPIYQLQGSTQSGPLTVAFAGREYTKEFFKSFLFTETPVEKQVGQAPFWATNKLVNWPSDIVIVEAAKYLIGKLPDQNAIVLPRVVYHTVDVRGSWEEVRSRFRKNTRKYILRLIRKYGYEYELSHNDQDFEQFYHHMYLPTMNDRHGELSIPISINEAYRYFQSGCLFRIMREGEWVSGVVCHPEQKVLITDIHGVKNADVQLANEGATSATYYAAIQWANEHGFEAVGMVGSRPYLESGAFQHKRRWGSAVSIPSDLHKRIWIKIQCITPAASHFLVKNPFVVVDKDNRLHGLIVVDDPSNVPSETKTEWEDRYATPGLDSLLVRSVRSFAQEPATIQQPELVIPIPLRSGVEVRQ